jgi:hypothetical protein
MHTRDGPSPARRERSGLSKTRHTLLSPFHADTKLLLADLQTERAPCGCLQKLTTRNLRVVEFAHLDGAKRYFPMIAVNERGAFYGPPPRAILPSVALGSDIDS